MRRAATRPVKILPITSSGKCMPQKILAMPTIKARTRKAIDCFFRFRNNRAKAVANRTAA